MLKCVAIALIALAVPCAAAASRDPESAPALPRVRPNDGRSAALLLDGLKRSETMRRLVAELENLHVIVYLEMQPGLKRQLAGRLVWVTAVANFRYVRISLNPDLTAEAAVSVLGHELQHALEVAHAPSIVDEASLEAYYREHGINMRAHTSGWDTQAARDAGDLVRREIAMSVAQRVIASATPFNALEWPGTYRRARDQYATR